MIKIEYFPMPPSINQMYATVGNRRICTRELNDFKRDAEAWIWNNLSLIRNGASKLHLDTQPQLELKILFYLPYEMLFTKKNMPKRWDCSNRIKALEDVIFALISEDDKLVFKIVCEKRAIPSENKCKMRSWTNLSISLLAPQKA